MTRLTYGLATLAAAVLSLIVLGTNTSPSVVDAFPVPQSLPDRGIVIMPDGNSYLIARLKDAPSITPNQLSQMGEDTPAASPVPNDYTGANIAPSSDGTASIPTNATSSQAAPRPTLAEYAPTYGEPAEKENLVRKIVHDNADNIGMIGGVAAGVGVTTVSAPVLGPVAPVSGGVAKEIVTKKISGVLKKCTEDNARLDCLKGEEKPDDVHIK
ncbi:hypothetical protein BDF22DRAFT_680250 [Syncephalis plumigaleata]|nr:hypothetical protein BDF22DRAFT_680250 [Syncephalis plumigaleata]